MSAGPGPAPRRAPAAVLFDLDGTLLDSLGGMSEALAETLAAHGHRVSVREAFEALDHSIPRAIATLSGRPPGEAARLAGDYRALYYERYYDRVEPLPGADALLSALASGGVPLALVTNRRERYAHLVLAHHRWAAHLPVVVGRDTARAPKPDPAPVLLALSRLGVPAGDAVFVGDTCEDMASARAAGVGVVVGLTHIRGAEALRAAGATHVAPGLPAVGALLGLPPGAARAAG